MAWRLSGYHWFKQWLDDWRHQAIIRTNAHLSSIGPVAKCLSQMSYSIKDLTNNLLVVTGRFFSVNVVDTSLW